jgi:hypothetical protein
MRNMNIIKTASVLAATAAVAAPAAAKAETAPSQSKVDAVLTKDYFDLAYPTNKKFGSTPISQKQIGNKAVTISPVNFDLNGQTESGADVEIQIDAFNKKTKTLQEAVIDVYTPQDMAAIPQPNSLFQIALYRVRYSRAHAPTTPAGYSRVIDNTATRPTSTQYDFNLGMQENGS